MLDTECQWSEALASNNIRAIIHWLQGLTAKGEADVQEILPTFSCWVQRSSELAKKELLTLCFNRCQGVWMFLDRSSFTRVHTLLQRLRNLLTLAQWVRRQLGSAHLWHGVGAPHVTHGCWNREHRALKQHIWLGRLVQWWGIMGLLPKYPEAHEVKLISHMWKEMEHRHRKACLETPGEEGGTERFRSLIQGMVTQLDRQHGCIWTSEDCTDRCYPPPNLQALLKLVLVPHIDSVSVQALLMYFVLDMANFLQCKDDLLKSFCRAFTIPPSFSQQIRAFWMLDHGYIKASMELLLSPRAAAPRLSWQHRCIIHCLLSRKQPQLALRYLRWTRPAVESIEDAKLYTEVLLQNSCVSEAWALLRRGHTENNDMVMYFLQACDGFGLCAEALKCIPAGYNGKGDILNGTTRSQLPLMTKDQSGGRPPCPLSAKQYQAQRINTVSPEEMVQLLRKAVMEVRKPHPKIREVVWPEHTQRKLNSREMFLSTQPLRHLTPSPSPLDMVEETEHTAHTDEQEEEQLVHNRQPESPEPISSVEDLSSGSVYSLPLLRLDRPYVYESTLTLQRISSFLTNGENQSCEEEEEEEEESRTPSSVDTSPDCPKPTMTLDGATDPVFLSNKDVLVELVLSAGDEEEDVFSSKDFDVVSVPSMDKTHPVNMSYRAYLPPQSYRNEVSQSVSSLCESQVESLSFLLPDYEKMASCEEEEMAHGPPDVTEPGSVALKQSDCFPSQIYSFSEAATSDRFLEKELHRKTDEQHQQEEAVDFSQGPSCSLSETTQDLLTDLHQSLLSEDPVASSSRISAPYATTESAHIAQLKTDEPCDQSTATWLDHCKMDTWWKEDLETCGAATGFLSATDAGAAMKSDNQRPPFVPGQPYSYSLVNSQDFTAKQNGDRRDGKQADKEEPAGWSSLGKGSRGAVRGGRTTLRKGKRVKRA